MRAIASPWNGIKAIGFTVLMTLVTSFYFGQIILLRCMNALRRKSTASGSVHLIATKWGKAVFTLTPGWQVEIEGRDFLPADGTPHVIVANHESAVDILVMYFLGIQFRWLAKASVFKIPMIGAAMNAAGYIPIERGNKESHRWALEKSATLLREDVSMLFFPEGTRSKLGKPKEFKAGAFRLAHECQVPILPVVLKGAGKLLTKGTMAPARAVLKIKILPPCQIRDNESVKDFTERVREMIVEEHALL